jgi:hypothetical protein
MTTTSLSCRLIFALCPLIVCALILAGCAKPRQAPLPIGNLKLGVAYFSQPAEPADMLTGYVVENTQRIEEHILAEMDLLLAEVLAEESKNFFHSGESALQCGKKVGHLSGRSNNEAALRTWSAIGRCMGVDLLVVPFLFEYRELVGSALGAAEPARVVMDIFILDVRSETLISRSRFDETQSALTSNLLEAGKFFRRGGRWISAHELAREGMEKAVKELRL